MYGPVTTTPQRRRGARVGTVLLRVVLTAVPVLSLGMLGWIPMLRLAIVHNRGRDWLFFGASAVASVAGIVLIGCNADDSSWQTTTGMVLLLGTAVSVAAYFPAADLRPPRAYGTPRMADVRTAPAGPPPGMARQDRIGQVRAELDELSAYLQQQDRA
ncbi:hypothetical protein [Kitasatospora sp. MAP5-34]|uniref:hypothetical protein n=1 Tax=Kitasatospora sp. MAP5-34 TaxID=3035102 RepID=UPI002476E3C1|nr:hypothetical protein [Kitasatospora sp. MAP5-34]MDH6577316.1 hypothetical protein [Kitasatospora sp. MAP5-34]